MEIKADYFLFYVCISFLLCEKYYFLMTFPIYCILKVAVTIFLPKII